MKSGVSVKIDKLNSVIKLMGELAKREILVGIPEAKAYAERSDDEAINNAAIGYILDHGSPINNIPARPWLIPGVKDAEPVSLSKMKAAAKAALDGDMPTAEKKMEEAGMNAQNKVRAKVNSNIQPKLADSTLAARKRRGISRTNTLVDTGALRDSVSYIVKKK